jgi:hypothetical protein
MGLSLPQFQKFMTAADVTLAALFPAVIKLGGLSYQASGVGGSALQDYLAEGGGSAPAGTRYFRLSKTFHPTRPAVGELLEWPLAPSGVTRYTIEDVPDRPHETSWVLVCVPRNR